MRTLFAVLTSTVLSLGGVAAQQTSPPDRAAVIDAAREVADSTRYCSFITVAEDGQPQARIIDLFPLEPDLTAWIGTKAGTRKVAQVQRSPRATLICFDAPRYAYVTLLGTAEVVTDPAAKARHWKPEWSRFYQDENRGEDYVLIRLRPARVEIASPAHGFAVGFQPTILDLK